MSTEIQQRLQDAIVRTERIRANSRMQQSLEQAQLPLWDERMRGIPNCLARCALFSCKGKSIPRLVLKDAVIASTAGVRITISTVEDLRQEESDVFMMLVHLARMRPLGEQIEVTAHQLLKALEWCVGKADYERLRKCIKRLTDASIWVSFDRGRDGFNGRLVEHVAWTDAGSGSRERWRIRLDPRILRLFGDTDFSLIDWQKRLQLRPTAKWLHNYFSSHREPLPISVARLYELCGSSNKRVSGFKTDLISALEELKRVGFLLYWSVGEENGLVVVRRNLSRLSDPILIEA